jgi:3-deoxy-7-phosphoheptulonate synthase
MNHANFKLASIHSKDNKTEVKVKGVTFGPKDIQIIAGPCSVESKEQMDATANLLKKAGIKIFRACAYKPRTHPYSFQGLGDKGLDLLKETSEKYGFVSETEVMDTRQVKLASEKADILRVGARNMQNYDLLKELGRVENPIILKNGLASTIEEFLSAAEYILNEGNPNVILCWRGLRTFEPTVRYSFDALSIPVIKSLTHLPVIADPSHPAGKRELVLPCARSAIASGADGLIVETHFNPEVALSDKEQQIPSKEFKEFVSEIEKVASSVGRKVSLRE